MPFVSDAAKREKVNKFVPYQHSEDPSFKETYDAAVGLVIDEELSISSLLNREGESTRKQLIMEKAEAGEIDLDDYRHGVLQTTEWNAIARDLNDPAIKTDAQLRQERNEYLANKRRYAENVLSHGSGMAQFMGGLNAYIIDPVNLATVGIATPMTASRATSILGRAAYTARDAAIVEGFTELGIQALVYDHKNDIESPYSAGDALANIAMASTGAAVLGGVQGGVSGWLDQVLKKSRALPDSVDTKAAREYLERTKKTVEQAPLEQTPAGRNLQAKIEQDFDAAVAEYATRPDAMGGKVLNTDTARELSPEYLADRTLSADVHEESSQFIKDLYARKLAEAPKPGEEPVVLFTAGGTGAGKTSAVQTVPSMKNVAEQAQVIYDTNMNTYASARKKIDQALDADKAVRIVLVSRDPVDALVNGALPQAERQIAKHGTGRTVPLREHLKTHQGAAKVIKQLAAEFKDDPRVKVIAIDNSRGKGKAALIPVEKVPDYDYNDLADQLSSALEKAYDEGQISAKTYQGFKGAQQGAGRVRQEIGSFVSQQSQPQRQKSQIELDLEFLEKLNRESEVHDRPLRKAANYERTDAPTVKKPAATASQRERDILARQGIADDYDADIAALKQTDNPVVEIDGEMVDARALVDDYDNAINGLDDVLRCVYG